MKDKNILVSIVIPTYNRANFIVEAVESVMQQSYACWEAIIIDDGSNDNTKSVLANYLQDPRFKYFYQENKGQSVARNKGIAIAEGDYICFLDSDNRWHPKKLEVSVAAAQKYPDVDIFYGDNITIDVNGAEISRESMKKYSGRVTDKLLRDNFISMNTTMAKRQCFVDLGGLDEGDRLAEDYELWLRMSTQYTFLHLNEYIGYYRVMEDQLSTDKDKRYEANYKILIDFIKRYPNAVTAIQKRRGLSGFFLRKGGYEFSIGRHSQAWKDMLTSMLYFPFWQGPWRLLVKLTLSFLKLI